MKLSESKCPVSDPYISYFDKAALNHRLANEQQVATDEECRRLTDLRRGTTREDAPRDDVALSDTGPAFVEPPEDDDPIWDVFLADDRSDEPEPEYGDFWLDGHDALGR